MPQFGPELKEEPPGRGWHISPPPEHLPLPPRPRRPWLQIALFLATVATTIVAGALQQDVDPLSTPGLLYKGIPFSFTLMLILGTHEMGHYLVSRWHRLLVTLPYFIPAPPYPFIIGTFGAFIRILSPMRDKRALLDVGCAGPLVGVALSIPLLIWGLKLSQVRFLLPGSEAGFGFILGEPLLFKLISWLTLGPLPPHHHVVLHPIAFAAWIGFLVTALNLLPVGQLDGGHVAYALFGPYHRQISLACFVFLLLCGLLAWTGWFIWALLLYILGFRHPPPYYDWVPLDRRRKLLGVLTMLVLILTFTPAPFRMG